MTRPGTPTHSCRGALLLEVMLSLSLFVSAGIAILALVHQSMADIEHTRQVGQAASIARSAMSRIESGIDAPQSLTGPVRLWDGRPDAMAISAFNSSDEPGVPSTVEPEVDPLWELEVESGPSRFEGLSMVRVRAFRRSAPGGDRVTASYTLHQLVRLASREEDVPGEAGMLLEEALLGDDGGAGR